MFKSLDRTTLVDFRVEGARIFTELQIKFPVPMCKQGQAHSGDKLVLTARFSAFHTPLHIDKKAPESGTRSCRVGNKMSLIAIVSSGKHDKFFLRTRMG